MKNEIEERIDKLEKWTKKTFIKWACLSVFQFYFMGLVFLLCSL